MTNNLEKVVTRFAPSPTGFMHIGGVRTALYAWLWARKNRGTFILRIEDTDQKREVEGSVAHIMESLEWLGLNWDYGPDKHGPFGSCVQSERMETYRAAAQILIDKGLAYPDPYTTEELEVLRKEAEAAKKPFLFREHRPQTFGTWDGTRPLRFKVPEVKRYSWHDEVRGDLSAGEEALDDFILIKADGYPTYNFAHIVDDQAMGVTHIMRGDEFISSTPRFLSLYDALELPYPKFVSLPPIMREDKTKKLGKRDGAKDILEYRADGYLPEAMRNFLALIGWNPGTEQELFGTSELLEAFDIARIHAHGGVFNEEKLRWFNREYLLKMRDDDFLDEALRHLEDATGKRGLPFNENVAHKLVPVLRERISVWCDVEKIVSEGEFDYFFRPPTLDLAKIPERKSDRETALKHLNKALQILEPLTTYEHETIKFALWDYASAEGRGAVLWPLRYALTGAERSPDPFIVASILGKEETLRRVKEAVQLLAV
jgi:glutamyl-tRNA synthetase